MSVVAKNFVKPEIGAKRFDKIKPDPGPTRKARTDLQFCPKCVNYKLL